MGKSSGSEKKQGAAKETTLKLLTIVQKVFQEAGGEGPYTDLLFNQLVPDLHKLGVRKYALKTTSPATPVRVTLGSIAQVAIYAQQLKQHPRILEKVTRYSTQWLSKLATWLLLINQPRAVKSGASRAQASSGQEQAAGKQASAARQTLINLIQVFGVRPLLGHASIALRNQRGLKEHPALNPFLAAGLHSLVKEALMTGDRQLLGQYSRNYPQSLSRLSGQEVAQLLSTIWGQVTNKNVETCQQLTTQLLARYQTKQAEFEKLTQVEEKERRAHSRGHTPSVSPRRTRGSGRTPSASPRTVAAIKKQRAACCQWLQSWHKEVAALPEAAAWALYQKFYSQRLVVKNLGVQGAQQLAGLIEAFPVMLKQGKPDALLAAIQGSKNVTLLADSGVLLKLLTHCSDIPDESFSGRGSLYKQVIGHLGKQLSNDPFAQKAATQKTIELFKAILHKKQGQWQESDFIKVTGDICKLPERANQMKYQLLNAYFSACMNNIVFSKRPKARQKLQQQLLFADPSDEGLHAAFGLLVNVVNSFERGTHDMDASDLLELTTQAVQKAKTLLEYIKEKKTLSRNNPTPWAMQLKGLVPRFKKICKALEQASHSGRHVSTKKFIALVGACGTLYAAMRALSEQQKGFKDANTIIEDFLGLLTKIKIQQQSEKKQPHFVGEAAAVASYAVAFVTLIKNKQFELLQKLTEKATKQYSQEFIGKVFNCTMSQQWLQERGLASALSRAVSRLFKKKAQGSVFDYFVETVVGIEKKHEEAKKEEKKAVEKKEKKIERVIEKKQRSGHVGGAAQSYALRATQSKASDTLRQATYDTGRAASDWKELAKGLTTNPFIRLTPDTVFPAKKSQLEQKLYAQYAAHLRNAWRGKLRSPKEIKSASAQSVVLSVPDHQKRGSEAYELAAADKTYCMNVAAAILKHKPSWENNAPYNGGNMVSHLDCLLIPGGRQNKAIEQRYREEQVQAMFDQRFAKMFVGDSLSQDQMALLFKAVLNGKAEQKGEKGKGAEQVLQQVDYLKLRAMTDYLTSQQKRFDMTRWRWQRAKQNPKVRLQNVDGRGPWQAARCLGDAMVPSWRLEFFSDFLEFYRRAEVMRSIQPAESVYQQPTQIIALANAGERILARLKGHSQLINTITDVRKRAGEQEAVRKFQEIMWGCVAECREMRKELAQKSRAPRGSVASGAIDACQSAAEKLLDLSRQEIAGYYAAQQSKAVRHAKTRVKEKKEEKTEKKSPKADQKEDIAKRVAAEAGAEKQEEKKEEKKEEKTEKKQEEKKEEKQTLTKGKKHGNAAATAKAGVLEKKEEKKEKKEKEKKEEKEKEQEQEEQPRPENWRELALREHIVKLDTVLLESESEVLQLFDRYGKDWRKALKALDRNVGLSVGQMLGGKPDNLNAYHELIRSGGDYLTLATSLLQKNARQKLAAYQRDDETDERLPVTHFGGIAYAPLQYTESALQHEHPLNGVADAKASNDTALHALMDGATRRIAMLRKSKPTILQQEIKAALEKGGKLFVQGQKLAAAVKNSTPDKEAGLSRQIQKAAQISIFGLEIKDIAAEEKGEGPNTDSPVDRSMAQLEAMEARLEKLTTQGTQNEEFDFAELGKYIDSQQRDLIRIKRRVCGEGEKGISQKRIQLMCGEIEDVLTVLKTEIQQKKMRSSGKAVALTPSEQTHIGNLRKLLDNKRAQLGVLLEIDRLSYAGKHISSEVNTEIKKIAPAIDDLISQGATLTAFPVKGVKVVLHADESGAEEKPANKQLQVWVAKKQPQHKKKSWRSPSTWFRAEQQPKRRYCFSYNYDDETVSGAFEVPHIQGPEGRKIAASLETVLYEGCTSRGRQGVTTVPKSQVVPLQLWLCEKTGYPRTLCRDEKGLTALDRAAEFWAKEEKYQCALEKMEKQAVDNTEGKERKLAAINNKAAAMREIICQPFWRLIKALDDSGRSDEVDRALFEQSEDKQTPIARLSAAQVEFNSAEKAHLQNRYRRYVLKTATKAYTSNILDYLDRPRQFKGLLGPVKAWIIKLFPVWVGRLFYQHGTTGIKRAQKIQAKMQAVHCEFEVMTGAPGRSARRRVAAGQRIIIAKEQKNAVLRWLGMGKPGVWAIYAQDDDRSVKRVEMTRLSESQQQYLNALVLEPAQASKSTRALMQKRIDQAKLDRKETLAQLKNKKKTLSALTKQWKRGRLRNDQNKVRKQLEIEVPALKAQAAMLKRTRKRHQKAQDRATKKHSQVVITNPAIIERLNVITSDHDVVREKVESRNVGDVFIGAFCDKGGNTNPQSRKIVLQRQLYNTQGAAKALLNSNRLKILAEKDLSKAETIQCGGRSEQLYSAEEFRAKTFEKLTRDVKEDRQKHRRG